MTHAQPPGLRQTPLRPVHERLGATMTAFAGWLMPLRYGSETAEHRTVRTAAGLFDLSHMGEIAVTGPEAAAALDYALVGQPSALVPGRARYTMICAADGGGLDDLIVYRTRVGGGSSTPGATTRSPAGSRSCWPVPDTPAKTALSCTAGPRTPRGSG